MPVVNPEQTASIISFLSYSFLDPMIWLAYRIPHLSRDQLPPLCDYDRAKNLIKRSYPVSTFTSLRFYAHVRHLQVSGSVCRCKEA